MKIPILIALLFLVGCSATEKAARLTYKGLRADSSTVVKIVRKIAPCVTTKLDTTIEFDVVQRIDTTIVFDTTTVQCPDSAGVKVIRKVVKQYFNIYKSDSFYITKTIKTTVEDQTFIIENRNLQKEVEKYKTKSQKRGNFILYLIIALLISILVNFIQYKRK